MGYRVRVRSLNEEIVVGVYDVREVTISGLTPSSEYTVGVAAFNSAGTGQYSNGRVYNTDG